MIAFYDALEQCYAHQTSACPAKGRQAGKTTSAARPFYRLGQYLNDFRAQLLDAALMAYPRGGLSRRHCRPGKRSYLWLLELAPRPAAT